MRNPLVKIYFLCFFGVQVAGMFVAPVEILAADRPNVLFIAVDDLNDWVGAFGGNIQMKTPHMDRLVDEGAMVFARAHAPAPVCCPSRTAIISGFMPGRSGVYSNPHYIFDSELIQNHATLPEYFQQHGYTTLASGKILHGPALSYPVVQHYQPLVGSMRMCDECGPGLPISFAISLPFRSRPSESRSRSRDLPSAGRILDVA